MYRVSGELEFDVRSGVANARLAARELENVGHKARRGGEFVDKFAKRMFGARSASEYLAKTLSRLGPSLIGGAVGGTALGAIVNQAKQAAEEMNKLADSLDKAVGAKAGASIGDTLGKINNLTTAIEESATKISKQSPLAAVAAFFMNEDAERSAKAFANAVEERIRLGNLLVQQTAEQNAQTEIASTLEGKLGEVYKINIAYRKRLAEIADIKGITEAQRDQLKILAEQARATQTRIVLTKELAAEEKKAFEERRKSDEEFAKTTIQIGDSLEKQEEARFNKNAEAFKKSQAEQVKAKEEAEQAKINATRNAFQQIARYDEQEKETKTLFRSILQTTPGGRRALENAEKRAGFLRRQESPAAEKQALIDFARERGIDTTKPGFQFQSLRKMMAEEATGMRQIPVDLGAVQKAPATRQIEGTRSVVGLLQIIAKKLPSPPIPV